MVPAGNKAKSLSPVNHTTKTIHHHHHHHHHHHQIYPNASIYNIKNKDTLQEKFFLEENLSKKQKEKQILKIHKQFGHSSSSSVKKIIHNAGALHSELSKIIDDVKSKCDICIKYRKPSSRPVVGYAKVTTFNETISMDLHGVCTT